MYHFFGLWKCFFHYISFVKEALKGGWLSLCSRGRWVPSSWVEIGYTAFLNGCFPWQNESQSLWREVEGDSVNVEQWHGVESLSILMRSIPLLRRNPAVNPFNNALWWSHHLFLLVNQISIGGEGITHNESFDRGQWIGKSRISVYFIE